MKRFAVLAFLVIAAVAILPAVGFDVNGHSVNSRTLSADGLGAPMPPGPYLADGLGAPMPPGPYLADGLGAPMPPGPYALA